MGGHVAYIYSRGKIVEFGGICGYEHASDELDNRVFAYFGIPDPLPAYVQNSRRIAEYIRKCGGMVD